MVSVAYAYHVGSIDGAMGDTIYVNSIHIEPTTRHYSLSPYDFVGRIEYDWGYAEATYDQRPFIYAPLNLPHGAMITKVVVYYELNGAHVYLLRIRLSRTPHWPPDVLADVIEQYADSLVITSITDPVVDNIAYCYSLVFNSYANSLYGARIEYVIHTPLP